VDAMAMLYCACDLVPPVAFSPARMRFAGLCSAICAYGERPLLGMAAHPWSSPGNEAGSLVSTAPSPVRRLTPVRGSQRFVQRCRRRPRWDETGSHRASVTQ